MNIRSKIRAYFAIFAVIAILSGIAGALSLGHFRDMAEFSRISSELGKKMIDQHVLEQGLFLGKEGLMARAQWVKMNDEIGELLESAVFDKDREIKGSIEGMRRDNGIIQGLFHEMAGISSGAEGKVLSDEAASKRQILFEQILACTRLLLDDMSRVTSSSWKKTDIAGKGLGVVFILLTALLFGMMAYLTILVKTFMDRLIGELLNFSKRVKQGDLDFRLDDSRPGELGDIALFLNDMLGKLRETREMQAGYGVVMRSEVIDKTKELNEKIAELERFRRATIGREIRMKELSDEIELLRKNEKG
ncbi:MAG: methyl-accepting chemotaxis protein [Candidatus Omnitrophica bacterium]|nr:methyl-accepting chemotaxis protein [Candidatus Omnitrophota bacterium]